MYMYCTNFWFTLNRQLIQSSRSIDEFLQHPIIDEFSQHPIIDEFSQHPITDEFSQHPITDEFSQHPITDEFSQHNEFSHNEFRQSILIRDSISRSSLKWGFDQWTNNNIQYLYSALSLKQLKAKSCFFNDCLLIFTQGRNYNEA